MLNAWLFLFALIEMLFYFFKIFQRCGRKKPSRIYKCQAINEGAASKGCT